MVINIVTFFTVGCALLFAASSFAENLFGKMHNRYYLTAPNCKTPHVSRPVEFVYTVDHWAKLNIIQKRLVRKCHSLLEPQCYNGFFPLTERYGFPIEAIKRICASAYDAWKPCCSKTDPEMWFGIYKAYCPAYMGNCPQFEDEFEAMKFTGTFESYIASGSNRRSPHSASVSTFNAQCPNFAEHCINDQTSPDVKSAIFHLSVCKSLIHNRNVQNCVTRYNGSTRGDVIRMLGCQKYKASCVVTWIPNIFEYHAMNDIYYGQWAAQ